MSLEIFPNSSDSEESIFKKIGKNISKARKDYIFQQRKEYRKYCEKKKEHYYQHLPQASKEINNSQKKVSKALYKNEKYLNKIENGKFPKDFGIIDLINICNAIHCTPNDILKNWIRETDIHYNSPTNNSL